MDSNVLEIVTALGEQLEVHERIVLVLKEGRRVAGWQSMAAAKSAATVGDRVVREVRLKSPWAEVAE